MGVLKVDLEVDSKGDFKQELEWTCCQAQVRSRSVYSSLNLQVFFYGVPKLKVDI